MPGIIEILFAELLHRILAADLFHPSTDCNLLSLVKSVLNILGTGCRRCLRSHLHLHPSQFQQKCPNQLTSTMRFLRLGFYETATFKRWPEPTSSVAGRTAIGV
jgi:hypothetical protein